MEFYSVYFVLLTYCALSHGFVVPMSFHKQTQPIKPSLDILSQTLEVATTTEASNYQFVGIDPKISGFLKPPMPTPAGLTRLPGQFQNVFDVLQEFVKDPGDQNSTVLNDSIDQIGQNFTSKIDSSDQVGQNSTIKIDSSDQVIQNSTHEFNSSDQIRPNSTKIETNYLNNQKSTVITESQDMNGQNSTDEIDSKDRNNQNSTVTIDSIDRISLNSTDRFIDSNDESEQNFTIIIDSQDRDSQKPTVTNDSIGQIVHNSSVVIESRDETEQNSIVTIDSVDRNKFNSTKGTSDEMLQPLEAINSFVVSDVIQSDVDIQNNSNNPQSVTHNVTTEEDNVFSKMTLEQWLNMAGELQQVIQNETTIPIDERNLVEANDAVQINEASLNETNPLTAGIYSTKYLAELPLTLSLRTTFSDSTNGLNNSSAEFINGTDGNVSNLSVAQNISEKFTAIGQITVTTVSPELSDDSLRKLISSERVTNHTKNYNNLVTTDIMTEESVVSPSGLISENSYTSVGEYFAAPYQVRPMDISERSGRDAVKTTSMIPNENISGGVSKINSFEAVPTNGNVSVEYSPAVTEHLTLFQNNGSMQTNTASTLSPGIEALPGESFDTSSNSTLATVSPTDTIPIDGMSMITVSLPVTNDTMENFDSIRSTAPLSFHLSSLTADVLDAIDLDHLSAHTIEPTKQNKTVLNPIYHISGEIYPNLDEMKAQFIEDAEEIPLEVQAEISEGILSTLSQNTTTQNFTSIPVTTGTSVIEKLKLSSLTQPDDLTTIATVSEIIVTSQYINLPTRYPSTNAVDASGIIHIPTPTSKSEEIISENVSPILGNIQLAKLSQNNSDDAQGTTINQLSNVSVPEKIYYLLRSDLVEDPIESEDLNVDSIAHPLENFLIPINFTSNETKVTFAETTPASQLTVIPLQKFDAKTSLFEITTSTPISELRNISHPFTNSPVVNPGVFSSISTNNLSNGTGQSIEREFASVSSEINKDNTHLYNDLVTLGNFHTQTVKTAIISDTVNYYNTRPTPDANTESFLTTNDNSSVKLYPTLPENIFTANDKPSANNNAEFMPVANISNDYSINNLASEISTLNSNGVENTNKTFPLFTVEQNSTVFVPPVSNPQNISDINDLSNVFLKRDNVLDTSLFLINRKPYDPEHSHDFNPSISETEMDTFSLNHSVPTNEEDGPLRIPLMIPNSAYIPPSDDHSELEQGLVQVIENNADAILGLESASIKSINSTVGPEVTSGIDIVNDSLEPSFKNSTFTSSSNPETIPNPIDLKNSEMPTVFSGYDAYLPSQNLRNSSYSTFTNILNFSADLESDVNLSPVTNQNIQVDDSNVFSVHNPSTIGVISVNGPILISEATVDYNTAFINSERQHDSIPTPVFISDDSYKNLGPPLISGYQLTNQNSEKDNNESIGKENPSHVALSNETPHTIKESLNLFPKSVIPEIHVDSTRIDTNISPPIQITPYSYNINNNFLKVPFNPEATIRFTRIDNFINDEVNSNASSSVASDNKESMLDSLHDINNESSGIEQLQSPNNNSNTRSFISVSSEPKTLFNSNRSTIIDTFVPQIIITSSHDTVILTPETNTRPAIVNSTTLANEPSNTENTTDLEMTNINDGLESTNKTSAAKNYLKTLGDTVVKGFHSMTKVFRPYESNKINVSDVFENTVGLDMLDKTDSVLIQKDILSGSLATNDSAPIPNANNTLTSNPELSDSYVNQNTYITQTHTMINTAMYPADLSDTLRRNSTNDTVQFPTDFTPSTITDEATLLLINMENTDDNNNFIYQKTTNSNPASIQEISAQPNIENTQQPTFTENRQIVNLANISDKASLTNIPAKTMYGQIIPEDTMIAAILKKEQVNVLEHPKAITTQIQITSRNYETTPFPVVMVANNPLQTFDQRVTEFLLNHNIITTTTKPDLPQSDDDIAYSHVENINPTLQSVETPTYIYNDIDTPSKTLLVNQSTPKNFAGSQPTQKMSPSFEKPLNPIAETNFALFSEEPIILNSDYVESIANVPTANVQNSQQVEHFSPNFPANFEPSIENITSFSDVNSAVGPQTVLNPNNVDFSENAPTIVPNLPIIQNVNQFPPASESVIEPTINFISSFVESSSNDPAIVSQNLQMEENMNHFPPGHLEVVEQQTVLNPSYVELPPNIQATVVQNYPVFENFDKNSQASQILNSESLSISPLIKVSNSSKVDELGHQTFLTNSADPASPIILNPNISTPPPNTPSLIKLNPLVLENLPSTLITNSATNTLVSNMASNSSALENSSSIPSSDSDNAHYLDFGKIKNLSPVEQSSSFETLIPILSPNSAPVLKSQVSDSSIASSPLYPILLNNFEASNAENATDSGIIQDGSYDNTSNLNGTEIPADIFNAFSG